MKLSEKIKSQGVKLLREPKWHPDPSLLLLPNVPKPMHGVAPRVVLGSVWWNKTRKEAYQSTSFHCAACGVWKHDAQYRQWLEGHEVYEINYQRGLMKYLRTVPLCHFCHNYIHDGRLQVLLEQGKISHAKYLAILSHGDRVLQQVGLSKQSKLERDEAILSQVIAPWGKWRLVIGRKKYPPLYKSFQEWEKSMRKNNERIEE